FNDSYLAKGETCHPSDNLGAVLAAAECANVSGRDFLTALAMAYQIECRLSEAAPVRDRGFDHVTLGAYSVAGGVAKVLELDRERVANAIAISGAANNALRVTRTGRLSHWDRHLRRRTQNHRRWRGGIEKGSSNEGTSRSQPALCDRSGAARWRSDTGAICAAAHPKNRCAGSPAKGNRSSECRI